MNEPHNNSSSSEPSPDIKAKQRSNRRSNFRAKLKSAAAIAAGLSAIGAICAALVGGFFLLVQPFSSLIIEEYWNRTTEIRVADVRFALSEEAPTIDIVVENSTKVAQTVILVEVGLHQEGLQLAMIARSIYQLNGEVAIERKSGALKGRVQGDDRVVYPFDGSLEVPARGGWTLHLKIPVREKLVPGDSRSIQFVIPSTIDVIKKDEDWMNSWLPFSTGGWGDHYLSGTEKNQFNLSGLLKGQGEILMRVRAKRGDGKMATYDGPMTF
jgi:hypothetical protein